MTWQVLKIIWFKHVCYTGVAPSPRSVFFCWMVHQLSVFFIKLLLEFARKGAEHLCQPQLVWERFLSWSSLVIQGYWNCLIFSRFGTNLSTSPALRMKNGNTWIYLVTYWSFIDLEGFIHMSFFHLSLRIQIICFSCNFTSICPPCLGFTNEGSGHHCPDLLVNCWCRF